MPHLSHHLLLLITSLSQQKQKENIISLFIGGVQALFPELKITWSQEESDADLTVFAVQTRNTQFGYLVIESAEGISPETRSLLQNTVQMVAVILERIGHEQALEAYRADLEEVVNHKTHDLIVRDVQFRNLFEMMAQGVVYQDQTGRITSANPAAERILGLSLEQMQGRTSMDPRWRSIHEDGSEFPWDQHPSMVALRTGKEVSQVVMGVFNPLNEDITWINVHAVPQIRPGEEKPFLVFTTFEDITQRKHDFVQLKRSEALYHDLVETSQDLIWQCDKEGRYTYLNPAWEEVFGYKVEEMLGKRFTDFQTPEYAARDLKEFQRLLKGDVVKGLETVHVGKEGNEIHLVFNAKFVRNHDGDITGTRGTAFDITSHVNNMRELRRLSTRYEAILSSVPDIIMEVDEQKVYTWANKPGLEFFGEGVVGSPADHYFEGDQDTYQIVQPLFNGQDDVIYVESWQRRQDGEKRLLAWWCRVLKNETGKVVGALSTARDITESRQAEVNLAERNQFIESLVNLQPNIVYIYDLVERKNLFSNDGIQRILGYNIQELQAMGNQIIPLLMYPDDLKVYLQETLTRYLKATDDETIHTEYRMRHKNGEWRWLSCNEIIFNRTPDGSPRQILGVIYDTTIQRNAEEEIIRLNLELEKRVELRTADLEAANKELESFAYSISHDLRAPLRAIEGYSAILQERYREALDAEGQRFLDVVRKSTIKMDTLITDLLDLSRISRRELRIAKIDMNEMVGSVIQEIASPAELGATELTIDVLPDSMADKVLIRQVWVNILLNAFKYTSKKKKRKISVGSRIDTPNRVTYWVSDNGVGFDNRYAEKIFGVFQRLHTDDEFEGTGVGLAIVDRIIRHHKGRVWAEAKVGKGATFYFTLQGDHRG